MKPIDFVAEIQPIFALHCLKCHGPEKRSGGLRLDTAELAGAGGDSGKPILGGTSETNELLRRVSSSDRTYRMPKNSEELPEQEIDRIRQWVEQKTPWPTPVAVPTSKRPFYERWLATLDGLTNRYSFEYAYVKPFAIAFLFAQVALLLIARAKTAYDNHRSWAHGRARWCCRLCSHATGGELSLVWLLSLVAVAFVALLGHGQKLAGELAKSRVTQALFDSPWAKTIYGFPPAPIRPDHPKQIAGTYFRGNCERNPALFNGGNYLTATFRIQLCDAEHKAVQVGDPLPEGGLWVRVEIERAPGTTDALFSKELMAAVFFSETFYEINSHAGKDQPLRLATLEDGRRWVVYFPIGPPNAMGKLAGLIYLYTGRIENGAVRGDPHYAVKYDLVIDDGKLGPESDLWMNSFGNAVVALPEPPGKIPYREWFDYRPIPPITGENSTDPKLLGLDEYVRKGLIKPEAAAPKPPLAPQDLPAGESPQNEPPAQKEE